jgi:putative ABC transport system permease protein
MFDNYIKTTLRFLKQNKVFASINILGLSIALTASFIILLYVINELSYDHFHKNRKQVFRIIKYYGDYDKTFAETPYVLASTLKENFPQVEKAIRTRYMRGFKLKLKDEYIDIPQALATDSEIFDIFTISMIGSTLNQNLLDDQNSIVLSRELAGKFFPNQDPLGKGIIGLANNEDHVFIVKGIYENIPENSSIKASCFVNGKLTIDPINKFYGINNVEISWGKNFWTTWILLSKDCNATLFEKQFMNFEKKNISEEPHNYYNLQNLSDVYLGSDKIWNSGVTANINNIRLFSVIAFLIVLVAAINYIILSTAVSTGRTKEIGIRKATGADNNNIRNQLLSESVLLALFVLPLALLMMWLALPYAEKLFQTDLQIISSNIIIYISAYLALIIFIGVASGIYTSSYLSRLKVINILGKNIFFGKRKQIVRSSLIVVQLVIFCSFVSCTFIIRSQYQYALKKNPGHYTKDILLINLGRDFNGYSAYINSIKSNPNVIMAAGTVFGLPMVNYGFDMFKHFQDKEQNVQVEGISIGYNFLKTMGVTILEGRDFSEEYGSDLKQSTIVNETAIKQLGITDPIGKMLGNQTIIGVVKDFNLHSIHDNIPPLHITLTDRNIQQVAVHYKSEMLNSVLPWLKTEWKKVAPDRPFSYATLEEVIKDTYSSEKNLSVIVSIFALFTLLIAAFGLFGLTLFVTRTRIKEIGIKKVFGSSEQSIIYSFLQENITLVLSATILSIPLTLYFMTKWLNNFSYKVNISWWIFVITFSIASIVVLSTVLIHSYKASRINPVEALKYE